MLLMDPETSAVLTELSSPPINSDLSVPVPGVCVSGGPGFMAMLSSQMKKSAPSSVSNHYNHISNEFVNECWIITYGTDFSNILIGKGFCFIIKKLSMYFLTTYLSLFEQGCGLSFEQIT